VSGSCGRPTSRQNAADNIVPPRPGRHLEVTLAVTPKKAREAISTGEVLITRQLSRCRYLQDLNDYMEHCASREDPNYVGSLEAFLLASRRRGGGAGGCGQKSAFHRAMSQLLPSAMHVITDHIPRTRPPPDLVGARDSLRKAAPARAGASAATPSAVPDQRRPGRTELVSPSLIPLLREPAPVRRY
jgi:hypothetical protein